MCLNNSLDRLYSVNFECLSDLVINRKLSSENGTVLATALSYIFFAWALRPSRWHRAVRIDILVTIRGHSVRFDALPDKRLIRFSEASRCRVINGLVQWVYLLDILLDHGVDVGVGKIGGFKRLLAHSLVRLLTWTHFDLSFEHEHITLNSVQILFAKSDSLLAGKWKKTR